MTCADAVYSPNLFNSVYNHVKDVDVHTDQNNVATLPQAGKCDSGVRGVKKIYHTKCFYHSDLDKQVVRGLIAKGNKTKALTLPKKQTIVTSKSFVRRQHAIVDHQSCGGVEKLIANVSHIGGSPGSIESVNECVLDDNVICDNINQVSGPSVMKQ